MWKKINKKYIKVLSEYVYSMLNKTIELIKPIQFDDSISINNNCFKDFFVVRKIMSIAKDYLENNQIKYDINDKEFIDEWCNTSFEEIVNFWQNHIHLNLQLRFLV